MHSERCQEGVDLLKTFKAVVVSSDACCPWLAPCSPHLASLPVVYVLGAGHCGHGPCVLAVSGDGGGPTRRLQADAGKGV